MPEAVSKSWGEMMQEAEAAAPPSYDPPPVGGPYDFQVVTTRIAQSGSGKPGIGFTAQVESGPHAKSRAGNTQWISKESPAAMAIFFKIMGNLGLTKEWFSRNIDMTKPVDDPNTVALIAEAIKGARFSGKVTDHRTSGDKVYADCSVDGPAKNPAPAGPPGPSLPSAAPVTQFPVPPTSPVAPSAPPAPTAPAAPADNTPFSASPPPPPPLGGGAPF